MVGYATIMSSRTLTVAASAALAAAIAASPAGAAESASAQGRAVVVGPMTLVNTDALSFGSFGAGASPGTVVINPDNNDRSVTGGVVPLGGDFSAAGFTGYTSSSTHVKVIVPKTSVALKRVGGTETMAITGFTVDGGKNQKFPVNQVFTFRVGGTLQVQPNQADGVYEGSFVVTAEYQ